MLEKVYCSSMNLIEVIAQRDEIMSVYLVEYFREESEFIEIIEIS